MSFTLDELKNALENYENENFDTSDFYHSVGYAKAEATSKWDGPQEIPGIGLAYGVETFGGEGQGDDIWVVFKVIGDDRLFRKRGYYASHYGTDWDGALEEVEAFEKVVTDYRPVN